MRQQTLAAQTGFEKYGRKTKRERFLDVDTISERRVFQFVACPSSGDG